MSTLQNYLLSGLFGGIVCVVFSLNAATVSPQAPTNEDDPVSDWAANSDNTYTVSATASGAPFVVSSISATNASVNSGASSSGASASTVRSFLDVPKVENFPLSITGLFGGDGDGNPIRWTVTRNQRFFWLTPLEDIVAEGTSFTVTANGDKTRSLDWTVSSSGWSKDHRNTSGSLTIGNTFYTTCGITIPTGRAAPLVGQHNISAKTVESPARTANPGSIVYVVSITKPANNGNPVKWEPGTARYDCQAVRSSVVNSYDLALWSNRAGRTDHSWVVSGGGSIANPTATVSLYQPPNTTTSTPVVSLRFSLTGTSNIDSRNIRVFEDHLERDYYNFGHNRTCYDGWKPEARYGVDTSELSGMGGWNCHGSVWHAYNNTTSGQSSTTVPWPPSVTRLSPDSTFWSGLALSRGDVVAFYLRDGSGTLDLRHSHTCLGNNNMMWGANNKGGWTNHWLWYQCTSESYYNDTSPRVNYVAILPKP